MKLPITKIKKELQEIKSRYKKKYGIAVFDIKLKSRKDFIFLDGSVLAERQKREILSAASKISNSFTIRENIKVLSVPKDRAEIGWGIIKNNVVDLWSIFFKKRIRHGDKPRVTQALKSEVVRLLFKKSGKYLAQTSDLAIGWINQKQISETKNSKIIGKWKKTRCVAAGGKIIKKTKIDRRKFVCFLEKYFNTPYLRGGFTEKGIDCSGLSNKFYLEIFGILLHRHSADQAVQGKEINFAQSRLGDLVFLRHRTKKYPHIGIVVDTNGKVDNFLILNARKENGGVIIQNFSEILKNYKLISTRRIIDYV